MSRSTLASLIRNIPDFPIPGVQFKDITTLLSNGPAFRELIGLFVERYRDQQLSAIVGVESRGFILSAPLAYELGIGFVPVRKLGKLPGETVRLEYALEYGTNTLEMHRDALAPGERVIILDDVLATGGTVAAAAGLVEMLDAEIVELAFLIELPFLKGRAQLTGRPIFSLLEF